MNRTILAGLVLIAAVLAGVFLLTFDESDLSHQAMMEHAQDRFYDLEQSEVPPKVNMSVERLADQTWQASIRIEDFILDQSLVDSAHRPGYGHGHIYLNGVKLGRVFSDSYSLGQLEAGDHKLSLTLNTNDHRVLRYGGKPMKFELDFTVAE